MTPIRFPMVLALLALCAGCRPNAAPTPSATQAPGYEFPTVATPPNSDRLFLVVSFSGGGTRAAALALGVLDQMTEDSVCVEGQRKSVADEIDIISAVSGGAFIGAYFALHGAQGTETFANRFLYYGAQAELSIRALMPEKLLHVLASPQYGRSDVAAELWDDRLFEQKTLGDLARRGRPYLYINATDMDAGTVFSFTGEQLRAMCIAADTFPIARAVAASSAVPGALSPVTVRNHAAGHPCNPPPKWTAAALAGDRTSEGYRYARALQSYADPARPYVHLLDGGLSDNSGARVPLRLLTTRGGQASILDRLDSNTTATVLFVLVDAQVTGDNALGKRAESPSVPKALYRGVDIALANTAFDVNKLLRDQIRAINAKRDPGHPDWGCAFQGTDSPAALCIAEVAFRNVADDSLRSKLNRLSTSFQLARADVDLLRGTGRKLIGDERAYRSLLESYSACSR